MFNDIDLSSPCYKTFFCIIAIWKNKLEDFLQNSNYIGQG